MEKFQDIFKRLRKQADLTQDQLAAELQLSRSAISMYERGEREPDFETLEAIADYFNVDMNYLIGWESDPTNYDDPDLIASIPPSYLQGCGGDVRRAFQMMKGVDEDAQQQLHSGDDIVMRGVELSQGVGIIDFPVVGAIAAGYNQVALEEYTGEKQALPVSFLRGRDPAEFFVLQVKGNSMYPQLLEDDKVLVRRCNSVDSGSLAVVLYNGDEATLKRVRYTSGENWLDLVPANPEYQTKRIAGADLEQCKIIGEVVTLLRNFK